MRGRVEIKQNLADKVIGWLDPVTGVRRMRARATMAIANSFIGASKSRRQTSEWNPSRGDADTDINSDLPTLRDRSRDLDRNNPIAGGVIKSNCTNIVGSGLKLYSRIDREYLSMSEEAAQAWEAGTEREWRLWADSYNCDIARILSFNAIQNQVLYQTFLNGDVFIIPARRKLKAWPYSLALQVIEADRVCNENNMSDRNDGINYYSAGVQKDANGAPIKYYVARNHPGSLLAISNTWDEIPAFSPKTGLKNIIHLFDQRRPGQTRGYPYLAPVIESLKQIGKYTDAELMATVIGAMFTVFIKTESGDGLQPMEPTTETGGKTSDKDFKLAEGAILDLRPGEEIQIASPARPNASFDPFIIAILKQVGLALEVPFEVLVKYFSSSYSAARASLLEAWRFYKTRRAWLVQNFCQIVYEIWMYEAILLGRVIAPGYLDDPLMRKAYTGSSWVGPAQGQIDPTKETEAAKEKINNLLSTVEAETAEITGEDFERNLPQIEREMAIKQRLGIIQNQNNTQRVIQI